MTANEFLRSKGYNGKAVTQSRAILEKLMEEYAHLKLINAMYGGSCIHQRPPTQTTSAGYPYICVLCGEQIKQPITF